VDELAYLKVFERGLRPITGTSIGYMVSTRELNNVVGVRPCGREVGGTEGKFR
jgi:hypothetical protein